MASKLVTQDDVPAARRHLMVNMVPLGQLSLPVGDPLLFNDQVNRLSLAPFSQDSFFVHGNIAIARADMHFCVGRLVHQVESSMQIKDKTARAVEPTLVNHFVILA